MTAERRGRVAAGCAGLWLAVVGCALAGCGGGSGGGSCGAAACGGNVAGTWTIASVCGPPGTATTSGSCAQATASVGPATETGTYTFNADLTFVIAQTTQASETWSFPAVCLSGGAPTCSQLNTEFQGLVGPIYSAVSCAMNASGGCDCDLQIDSAMNISGTYATAGSALTITVAGASEGTSYCVQGPTLKIVSTAMPGVSGTGGGVVLAKE